MLLFTSGISFNLFFTTYCFIYLIKYFKKHKLINIIFSCKPFCQLIRMFETSSFKIVCNTCVKHIIIPVSHDVDKIQMPPFHEISIMQAMTNQK